MSNLIIKRLQASFGCLDGAELNLDAGVNVVRLPNEGGKSTWLAFIMAMLYGVDTSERDSKNALSDKNRYRPWSGAPMQGSMGVVWNGVPVTIRRTSGARSVMQDFSACNTETGQPIESLTASNCGQTLIGVEKSVFERSAYIHQGQLGVEPSAELERRLQALVSTGEESYSFSDAEARLSQWLRKLKSGGSGEIPRLETEKSQIESQLDQLSRINREIVELTGRSERLNSQQERLKDELEAIERQSNHEIGRQIAEAKQELDRETAEDIRIRKELSKFASRPEAESLRAMLRAIEAYEQAERQVLEESVNAEPPKASYPECFNGLTSEAGWDMAQADFQDCGVYVRKSKKSTLALCLLWLLPLAAGIAVALTGRFLIPGLILSGVSVLGFIISFLVLRKRRTDAAQAADEILAMYGASEPAGILDAAGGYRTYLALVEEFHARLNSAKSELDGKRDAIFTAVSKYWPDALDIQSAKDATYELLSLLARQKESSYRLFTIQKLHGTLVKAAAGKDISGQELQLATLTREEAESELSAAEEQARHVTSQIAMNQGQAKSIGDSAELSSRCEQLTMRLENLNRHLHAVSIARQSLTEAHGELQGRFSPRLNQRAGELLARLTGGRYEKILLDKKLSAETVQSGDMLTRSQLYLSTGALDQLYLSVRLALCDILLPETAPLFFDDAFSSFDSSRLAAALELLKTEYSRRQIVIFTCHEREAQCLGNR